jgi:rubrerythrin
MSIGFNADEILEMVIRIEQNGAKFYRRAAEGFTNETVRKTLLDLAVMEDGHEKTFAEMKEKLSDKEHAPTVFDPEGQAAGYLQAMADGHVFDVTTDPSETLTGNESWREIIKKAIALEKDSIVFYTGIRELVPESLGKDKIEEIIREEMGHVTLLTTALKLTVE